MGMHIFRALLLSSRSQAEYFEPEPPVHLLQFWVRYRYRLVASYYAHSRLRGGEGRPHTWTLRIYRLSYPPTATAGTGAPSPVCSPHAHATCQFEDKGAFYNFLRRHAFAPDNGWQPVEEEETQEGGV